MQLAAILMPSGKFRVHQADCSDIRKDEQRSSNSRLDFTADTEQAAAEWLHSDFIDEGSMEADEAPDYCDFVGCTRDLPA